MFLQLGTDSTYLLARTPLGSHAGGCAHEHVTTSAKLLSQQRLSVVTSPQNFISSFVQAITINRIAHSTPGSVIPEIKPATCRIYCAHSRLAQLHRVGCALLCCYVEKLGKNDHGESNPGCRSAIRYHIVLAHITRSITVAILPCARNKEPWKIQTIVVRGEYCCGRVSAFQRWGYLHCTEIQVEYMTCEKAVTAISGMKCSFMRETPSPTV